MLFKNKQREDLNDNHIVALDIGTEFVKALVAEIHDDEIRVIGVGRARQEVSDMHSGAIADIASVVQNCETALIEAEDQAEIQAKKAVIGIAGELVKGATNTIKYRRPQPNRPLDEAEMEFIIDKIQERAQLKAQREIALETGNQEAEIKLVNSAIVGIHIDGYKVSNPIGFQGKDVSIQIYTAFAPTVHIGAIERVANELALDLIAVAAEPFAVYKNAEKLKVNLSNDKLKSNIAQQAMDAIENTLDVWVSGVELALSDFENIDYLPSRILLCGGGSSLESLTERLENSDWWKELPFNKKPTVKHIKPEEVSGVVDESGKINDHTFITAMGLLRVGYDTYSSDENASENFRDKLNRILRT